MSVPKNHFSRTPMDAFKWMKKTVLEKQQVQDSLPGNIEILGWCPAGTVLPHGKKVPL